MKYVLMTVLWAFLAVDAVGDTALERANALGEAFDNWAAEHEIATPGFVVMHKGHFVGNSRRPNLPVEMASLSKAITAVCAATLIEEGIWSAKTTSAQVLGYGHDDITVAQLIGHIAGLYPDSTQTLMPMWITSNVARKRIVTETALNRRREGVGSFQYNNENYAVLGEMIEIALGMPYEQACQYRALAPAGIDTATASDLTGGTLPWGGWKMTAQDYARFHYHWFGPSAPYGRGVPASLRVELGGGAAYGLGMFQRAFPTYKNFWHFGAWCVDTRVNTGSYAVIWKAEWSVVAVYDKCVDWDTVFALDAALSEVAYAK